MEDNFSTDWKVGVGGCFKRIIFIVQFTSIIMTSAPPQIIRHWIPEVGDAWLRRIKLKRIMKSSDFIFQQLARRMEKAMAPHSSTLAWKIP